MSAEEWEAAGNDPDDYMSPEEFAKVGELRDDKGVTRQQLAKRLVQQEKLLSEVLQNQNKMLSDAEERGREAERQALDAKQQEAIEDGDTEKALEIEREKAKLDKKPEPNQPQMAPEVQSWYDNNKEWYGVAQGPTDLINVELSKSERNGVAFEDAIEKAMVKAKKYYPAYFDDEPAPDPKPKPKPARMTERSQRKAPQKTKSFNDLPVEMRAFAKKAAKTAGMTEAEYMENYA